MKRLLAFLLATICVAHAASTVVPTVTTNGVLVNPATFWHANGVAIANAASTNTWTLVYVPDAQYLTNATRAAMAGWVTTHLYDKNIQAVLSSGDQVDDTSSGAQWINSTNYWHVIRGLGIPNLVTVGNHDYDSVDPATIPNRLTAYELRYGSTYYTGQSWFNGGFYNSETDGANVWFTRKINGQDWLFVSLEWGPRDGVMDWVYDLATNRPNHKVVITTHVYLQADGSRDGESSSDDYFSNYGVHSGGVVTGRNNAEQMWQGWLKKLPNLVLVLSGHHPFHYDGYLGEYDHYSRNFAVGRSMAWGDSGNPVWQIMANYQGHPTDADPLVNGWFRIMEFAGDKVHVSTYSTTYATNRTGNLHDFTINLGTGPDKIGGASDAAGTQYRSTASLSSRDLIEGLWFYCPLNEGRGTNVLDVIGGARGTFRARTAQSITVAFSTNGINGSSLFFQNYNYVNFGNVQEPLLKELSGSVWFKGYGGANCSGTFVSRDAGSVDGEFNFALYGNQIRVKLISDTTVAATLVFDLPITGAQIGSDNQWHHYGFVYDGVRVTAYFDGVSLGTQAGPTRTVSLNTSDRELMLGDYQGHGGGEEWTLSGYLDEVMLWNRALSPKDMHRLATEYGSNQGQEEVVSTVVLDAADTIYALGPVVRVIGDGAVTMTSTPTVRAGSDGQVIEIWGRSDSSTVTLQDEDTLTGSGLQLGANTRTLTLGASIRLRYEATSGYWYETPSFIGAGGGGSPGGDSLQIQYNNAGSFGGTDGMSWDAGDQKLTTPNLTVQNDFVLEGSGTGSVTLKDSDASNTARITAADTTTTDINLVLPAAPATGFLLSTLGAVTNATLSIVSATGSGNVMRTRTGVTREIWVPAGAMNPSDSSPAAAGTNLWLTSTDGQTVEVYDFDPDTAESVQFTLTLPVAWDASTVKAKLFWKPVNATTGDCVWTVAGGSLTDGETGGNSLGTGISVTDTVQTGTNTVHVTAATSAITVGGTPSAGHMVWFKVSRTANSGSDTMANDARLFGVQLQYTESATEATAW